MNIKQKWYSKKDYITPHPVSPSITQPCQGLICRYRCLYEAPNLSQSLLNLFCQNRLSPTLYMWLTYPQIFFYKFLLLWKTSFTFSKCLFQLKNVFYIFKTSVPFFGEKWAPVAAGCHCSFRYPDLEILISPIKGAYVILLILARPGPGRPGRPPWATWAPWAPWGPSRSPRSPLSRSRSTCCCLLQIVVQIVVHQMLDFDIMYYLAMLCFAINYLVNYLVLLTLFTSLCPPPTSFKTVVATQFRGQLTSPQIETVNFWAMKFALCTNFIIFLGNTLVGFRGWWG